MNKLSLFFIALLIFTGCNQQGSFSVSGNLTDADGVVIYLEKNSLLKDSLIDSVKISKNGKFQFKVKSPRYPDFYRLIIGNERLVLGIDSIEKIEIEGSANNLLEAKIAGSQQSEEIQRLRKAVRDLQQEFDLMQEEKNEQVKQSLRDSFQAHFDFHRREVFNNILVNPLSMAGYFALYQQVNGQYLFSPYLKTDLNYFRAIATSFQNKMPEYERTKNLYSLVLGALQEKRANEGFDWSRFEVGEESGFLEIELPDRNGYKRKLSEQKGKVIIIDFAAYSSENSINHTFELRQIYDQYKNRAFEIYQISLDNNKMFWLHSVSSIPWITVIDDTGYAARLYNVTELPTLFLMDKSGAIIGKYKNIQQLKSELSKIL